VLTALVTALAGAVALPPTAVAAVPRSSHDAAQQPTLGAGGSTTRSILQGSPSGQILYAVLPTAPEHLAVTSVTSTSVSAAWDVVLAAARYRLTASAADGQTVSVTTTAPRGTIMGLPPGSGLHLWVTAIDAFGRESGGSQPITVTTRLPVPTSLAATVRLDGVVEVSWTRPASANLFTVRGYLPDGEPSTTTVATTAAQAVLRDVPADRDVTLRVEARDTRSGATSEPATAVVHVPLLAPTRVRVTSTTATSVTVRWKGVVQASSYTVQVTGGGTSRTSTTTGTSLRVAGLARKRTQLVLVSANVDGRRSVAAALLIPLRVPAPVRSRVKVRATRIARHRVATVIRIRVPARRSTPVPSTAVVRLDPKGPSRSTGKPLTRQVKLHRSRPGTAVRGSTVVTSRRPGAVRVRGKHLRPTRVPPPKVHRP